MCQGCWEEYGSPQIVNENTKAVAALVKQLYMFSCVGGNLHIVTDDWNLEDSHLEFCHQTISNPHALHRDNDPHQLAVEGEICARMKVMSEEERASALAIEAGYFEVPN